MVILGKGGIFFLYLISKYDFNGSKIIAVVK